MTQSFVPGASARVVRRSPRTTALWSSRVSAGDEICIDDSRWPHKTKSRAGQYPRIALRPHPEPPGRRRHAHHLLEGAAEGGLGLVADFGGDHRHAGMAAVELFRSHL